MDIGNFILALRLTILPAAGLAQTYLFLAIRRHHRSSRRPGRARSAALWAVGLLLALLWGFNAYVVVNRLAWVEPPLLAQALVLYPAAVWTYASVPCALVLLGLRIAGSIASPSARSAGAPRVDLGRRRFLAAGLAAAPVAVLGYGAAYGSTEYEVTQLALPFGRTLRVVQLSDIHAGLYMTREQVRRYVDFVNQLQPDLFVITGDFISNSMYFLYGCVEELARVRSRYGSFGVLGNHEHWFGDPREAAAVLSAGEIRLLNNAHRTLETAQGPCAVVGIDDLRSGRPDLEAALRGVAASMPTLLLSHHPEVFSQAADHGVAVTLSGHWHGGQIRLPLPGVDLNVARLLTPYPAGLYRRAGSHLYVNRGIGTTGPPIRLNAAPEITLLHLR